MKKYQILLLTFLFMFVFTLTGCNCEPQTVEWYIDEVRTEMVFLNGVKNINRKSYIDYRTPFVSVAYDMTYIKFNKDMTVIFKPIDGNELSGKFSFVHNGFTDTTVTIQLENNQIIQANCSKGYGFAHLEFEYNGDGYSFSEKNIYDYVEKFDKEYIESEIIYDLRNDYRYNRLDSAKIIYDGEYKLIIDGIEVKNLSATDSAIYAMKLTSDDELIVLDSLREGKCLVSINNYDSGVGRLDEAVTIYYVEPYM